MLYFNSIFCVAYFIFINFEILDALQNRLRVWVVCKDMACLRLIRDNLVGVIMTIPFSKKCTFQLKLCDFMCSAINDKWTDHLRILKF